MKPLFEKVENDFGSSFSIGLYEASHICSMPFWHIHPEFELVYIKNGYGKRRIGNTISNYSDGDLIMLGPNIPHTSFCNHVYADNVEVVIQFDENLTGSQFWRMAEMSKIAKLFQRSVQGISFGKKVRSIVAQELVSLSKTRGFNRFIRFLHILQILAESDDYELLHAKTSTLVIKTVDYNRVTKVYNYVEANFQKALIPEEIAQHINMTLPAFCRFFKRTTKKTFTTFLNEFRIAHACQLVLEGTDSLATISAACGFQSASYFNKQFKRIVGTTPTDYKMEFEKVLAH